MAENSKTDFLRGVVLFNPKIYSPSTHSNRKRISARIADYKASRGGFWGYDNFYQVVKHVLKGASFEQAMAHFESLEGAGEAPAKTGLLTFIENRLRLTASEYVDCGPRNICLSERHNFSISPDFAFRRDGVIRHVFVYPNSEPALSDVQRNSIKSLMSQPFSGAIEQYRFCLIEYPVIKGKRVGSCEEVPFGYGGVSEEFIAHMSDFYVELSQSRGGQGTMF